jgi:hypothetical protein
MAEQHLDRPDIGTRLEQMGRDAVSQGVQSDVFAEARGTGSLDTDPVH